MEIPAPPELQQQQQQQQQPGSRDSDIRSHTTSRSSASSRSGVSSSTAQGAVFQTLSLVDSPQSIPLETGRPASSSQQQPTLRDQQQQQQQQPQQPLPPQKPAPSPYISPVLPQHQNFLPTPVSQTSFSSFQSLPEALSEDIVNAPWYEQVHNNSNTRPPPPIVRVDPVQDYPSASLPPPRTTSSSLPTSQSQSSSMSAVATLHFDPAFNMGSRSQYGWPVLESGGNGGLLGHDLGSYNSDASLTPPSGSRSVTASPPRLSLTPEQRELKRQRDQARRDMKQRDRARRGTGPYVQSPPPVTMADLSSPEGLPVYTTGPTQISLLTEPTTTLAPAPGPYMSSYSPQLSGQTQSSYSPQLSGQTQSSYSPQLSGQPQSSYSPQLSGQAQSTAIFPPAPYQQQPYMTEYPQPYPGSSAPSLPSHYGSADATTSVSTYCDASSAGAVMSVMMLTPPPSSRRPPMPHPADPQQSGMLYPMPVLPGPGAPHEGPNGTVRVVQTRPKPQCWEHGCNGRQFSTFSNLLRHQREKSGQAAKAVCPNCGAEFTRTTARNGHMQHEKCKPRRGS